MLQQSASQEKVSTSSAMSVIPVKTLSEALLHREQITAFLVFSNAYVEYRAE